MKKINKAQARKLYNQNKKIIVVAHKLRPGFPWNPEIMIQKTDLETRYSSEDADFDKIVREYEWYNCNYETGYYSAFYLP